MTTHHATTQAPGQTIAERIATACASTKPRTKERNKALASVRWVLSCADGYAALSGLQIIIVPDRSSAQVFDGRDNEETKARFYSAALKTNCMPVLLP